MYIHRSESGDFGVDQTFYDAVEEKVCVSGNDECGCYVAYAPTVSSFKTSFAS